MMSTAIYREQGMSQAVDWALRLSAAFGVLEVSESILEFVSDSNSEFFIFFFFVDSVAI